MDFFVLHIDADGTPGRLVGPHPYDGCCELISKSQNVPQEAQLTLEMDGVYSAPDGSTWYVLMSQDSLEDTE